MRRVRRARRTGLGLVGGLVVAGAACSSGVGGGNLVGAPPVPEAPDSGLAAGGSPICPIFGLIGAGAQSPPPLSGGTLLVSRDGTHAIAADPDRDAVYVVDLRSLAVETIALNAGDEPGRLVEDGAGRVHVALRSAGAVVTIDPATAAVTDRAAVCPAPRGVAWDSSTDLVWVACATGELVALPSAGGAPVHSYVVERDLRDVVASGGSLTVSLFRAASLLHLAADGTVAAQTFLSNATPGFASHVAWRTIAGPAGTMAVVHQEESTALVTTTVQGGYGGCNGGGPLGEGVGPILGPMTTPGDDAGVADDAGITDDSGLEGGAVAQDAGAVVPSDGGALDGGASGASAFGCTLENLQQPFPLGALGGADAGVLNPALLGCTTTGIVRSDLTVLGPDGSTMMNTALAGALPVDVAFSADGSLVAFVTPGNTFAPLPNVFEVATCTEVTQVAESLPGAAEPTAVAFDGSNRMIVQSRQPAQLWIFGASGPTSVTLSQTSRADLGYDIFHVQAGGMIACASCHPEGGDDGHVWNLDGDSRRTPSLRGTIAGTAPYHWPGDMKDLPTLFDNVYTVRMNGAELTSSQIQRLESWVQSVPAPPAPSWVDPAAAARGKTLFGQYGPGCSGCHSGAKFTDNRTLDVGTGGAFQVPPLVGVGWRAPFLHDGCATTLADRFGSCATPGHGDISSLSSGDISDLVAYLETL
jgi:hypothetical protein